MTTPKRKKQIEQLLELSRQLADAAIPEAAAMVHLVDANESKNQARMDAARAEWRAAKDRLEGVRRRHAEIDAQIAKEIGEDD